MDRMNWAAHDHKNGRMHLRDSLVGRTAARRREAH